MCECECECGYVCVWVGVCFSSPVSWGLYTPTQPPTTHTVYLVARRREQLVSSIAHGQSYNRVSDAVQGFGLERVKLPRVLDALLSLVVDQRDEPS